MPQKKIIAVVGPTASGKSALAMEIARSINGVIISCDSMQIYRGMDIGTAKPTQEDMSNIPHRMIDICDPWESYCCADYANDAKKALDDTFREGKMPVFCGGTGLYLDSVLDKTSFSPDIPSHIREELSHKEPDELYDMLTRYDPLSAEKIHRNNVKRVIRALEIYLATGKPKSEWDELSHKEKPEWETCVIGLDYTERSVLYERIDRRVDEMIEAGLRDEVKSLYGKLSDTASQAIGYKEYIDSFEGKCNEKDVPDIIKQRTRNYAKRQLTWFKRREETEWIKIDKAQNVKNIVNNANKVLTTRGFCDIIDKM